MSNPFEGSTATLDASPFAQPGSEAIPQPLVNPFAQPSRDIKYPKLDQLIGRLIILVPRALEVVAKSEQYANEPGETEERYTTDMIVLDGGELNGVDELPLLFEGMWINQQSIVGALKGAKGAPILGRIRRHPQKKAIADFPDPQAVEEGLRKHFVSMGALPKPAYLWKLDKYNEDVDLPMAMKWFAENRDFL